MGQHKLPIYWPVVCVPEQVEEILNDETMTSLLRTGRLRARMYKIDLTNFGYGYRKLIIDPSKPHMKILEIDKSDHYYEATCDIPDVDLYKATFATFKNPVLFPTILYDTKRGLVKFVHFAVTEYSLLEERGNAYGGIYPYPYGVPIIVKEDS